MMFSCDMHNCSKTNKIYHITYFYIYMEKSSREKIAQGFVKIWCVILKTETLVWKSEVVQSWILKSDSTIFYIKW